MEPKPDLIFDIGMHIGEDTEFYLKKGFRVVALDANAALCDAAEKKFSSYVDDGRLTIVNRCISEQRGKVPFYINEQLSEWSSANKQIGERKFGAREVEVESVSTTELFEEFGVPYYMKVDIEGFDELPIVSLRECSHLPVYVSFEATSFGPACLLYAMGFRRFSVVLQRSVENCTLPNPAQEGVYCEHKFPLGSSGPFGKELQSAWGTIDDCVRWQTMWRHLMRNNPGQRDEWADIHAYSAESEARFRQM